MRLALRRWLLVDRPTRVGGRLAMRLALRRWLLPVDRASEGNYFVSMICGWHTGKPACASAALHYHR